MRTIRHAGMLVPIGRGERTGPGQREADQHQQSQDCAEGTLHAAHLTPSPRPVKLGAITDRRARRLLSRPDASSRPIIVTQEVMML